MTWQMMVVTGIACVGGTILVWMMSGIAWLLLTRNGTRTPWWLVPLFAYLNGGKKK